jgi:hypothetical protein
MKKIAKNILPYTTSAHSKNTTVELKELSEMLMDTGLLDQERGDIEESIKRVQKGDKLSSHFVIGVFDLFDEFYRCDLFGN